MINIINAGRRTSGVRCRATGIEYKNSVFLPLHPFSEILISLSLSSILIFEESE